jgi:hypothetical protein
MSLGEFDSNVEMSEMNGIKTAAEKADFFAQIFLQ